MRSQTGRILSGTLTDGSVQERSSYWYDGAGRLVRAVIPRHDLSYTFASSGGCGANVRAGLNGNRMGSTDVLDGGTPTTVRSCFDNADRLTSTTVTGAPSGATAVSRTVTASSIMYDATGSTTALADQRFTYDAAGRHVSTSAGDGTDVTYVRDGSDRIVERTQTVAGTTSVQRYGFTGPGDSPDLVLDAAGVLVARTLTLPGGVLVNLPVSGGARWSYPNVHGDLVVTTEAAGARIGARASYDPFGQPIDPVTGRIGTTAADDAVPDTLPGDGDNAWVGQHQKLYEHAGPLAAIEMGARVYLPGLGRFLSVDPVEGGVDNAYAYPADPINMFDLDGEAAIAIPVIAVVLLLAVALAATVVLWQHCVVNGRGVTLPTTVSIPMPRSGTKTAKDQKGAKYLVYEIHTAKSGTTYEYGISRAGGSRPQSQLGKCAKYFSQACTWSARATRRGWVAARPRRRRSSAATRAGTGTARPDS
ncbi:RHS repeat-associated core domain-containing protein [Cellulomonas flavigena]|uniref:RHS repeat-associated core domain-containing protein n=1 Tax=Cellulomonas flavigena TaxID=1711 RepID=UPI0011D22268|nr:RHS repeat-associated core domain-containing protein [Cellulomonas flavigena]